jgi:hypothetical protein
MNSPFPGMDPYFEDPAFWEDFHLRFLTQLADALLGVIPANYDAHINERVRLVSAELGASGTRLPDVSVDWKPASESIGGPPSGAGAAVLEPVTIPMTEFEEHRDVWIEIVHLPDRNLVTTIEVLSPTNKTGNDAVEYQHKRIELYARRVNLVEIDLLLGGKRVPLAKPLPPGDYYALVTRETRRPLVEVYTWALADRLPEIPVPLKSPDPDVRLDLQDALNSVYERGHFARRLRYSLPPPGPVSPPQEGWIQQVMQGRR